MKVGIFDSGIGGLSVLHQALQQIPGAEFIYYADEAHVPYGEKPKYQIKEYVDEIIEFMLNKDVSAVVIACNTATSVATKEYRSKFCVPVIGMEPAVKPAAELYSDVAGRILVAATPVTIAGDKLHNLLEKIEQKDDIDLVALPKLVRYAERGDFESEEIDAYLKDVLKEYPLEQYKAFVLGCTHFNYFKEHFKKIFPESMHYIDGNGGTIRQLIRKLPKDEKGERFDGESKVEYYFSGNPVTEAQMRRIDGYMHHLEKIE